MKVLKTVVSVICIFTITSLFFPNPSFAEIPRIINYQGKLTDPSGKPVSDGTYSITFKIYEQEAGGSPLWYETQSVTTQKGLFSTQIGATKDLNLTFDKPYWLGIKVGTDAEMTPRQPLTSTGYTFQAAHSAVAATLADETKLVPSGVILMWSGSIGSIPDGWLLCDGTNGTPDLRDRFIIGTGPGAKTSVGDCGPDGSSSGIDPALYGSGSDLYMRTSDSGTNSKPEWNPVGTCTPQHVRLKYFPPYYALCYIMKL